MSLAAARKRVQARTSVRCERGAALVRLLGQQDVDPLAVDSLSRQVQRARLLDRADLAERLGHDEDAHRQLFFEVVIGQNDMLPARFLGDGAVAARSVGRIRCDLGDRNVRYGTGFLIAPRLLLTNNHVLETSAIAAAGVVQFGYADGGLPSQAELSEVPLSPDEVFFTDVDMDISVVAVGGEADRPSLTRLGWHSLLEASGKALIGEPVNVIHHAGGRPQEVSIRANRVVDVVDQWIHYSADTEAGSSGAPVFNDDWYVVAIHHAAVPVRGPDGTTGVINEGVRASAIVARLQEAFEL